jgi:hypothetical protein
MWTTPTARDGDRRGGREPTKTKGGRSLRADLELWPTPTMSDANGSGSRNTPGSKAHAGVSLSDMVATGDSAGRRDRQTPTGGDAGSRPVARRWRLNPAFVELLMGLPVGWTVPEPTGCAASATPSSPSRPPPRGES